MNNGVSVRVGELPQKNSIVMVKGYFDLLAHLVERKTANFDVVGSIPT